MHIRMITAVSLVIRVCAALFSHVQLFATPWTVAHQAPLSMEFSGKDTGVGSHFLLQGIFLTQGSNQISCIAGRFVTVQATMEWGKNS